eukprot:767736-Hanusia_phi.AAC.3
MFTRAGTLFSRSTCDSDDRQKQTDMSVMSSVVGTLTYSCPEIIERFVALLVDFDSHRILIQFFVVVMLGTCRRPYTEKADIWSLGVILYQTAANIVEGRFEPISDPMNEYSDELKQVVTLFEI